MDLTTVTTAFSSIKAAGEIAKSLISLHTTVEVQSKVIELNHRIIEAQQLVFATQTTQSELVSEVSDLKGQIARMKNWETEKQRYKLAAPFPGCMVYALQKAMSGGETAHYLCTACYQKGQPSILQGREAKQTKEGRGNAAFICDVCGLRAEPNSPWVPAPQYFEDIVPQG